VAYGKALVGEVDMTLIASAWKELSFTGKVRVQMIGPLELLVLGKSTSQSLQGRKRAWSRVNQSGGNMGPRDGPDSICRSSGDKLIPGECTGMSFGMP